MLAKSNSLKKSVIDMNTHYLELNMFLQELTHHPDSIMNKGYNVTVFIMEMMRKLIIGYVLE